MVGTFIKKRKVGRVTNLEQGEKSRILVEIN